MIRNGVKARFYQATQRTAGGADSATQCAFNRREQTITFDMIPADIIKGDLVLWENGDTARIVSFSGTTVTLEDIQTR